MEVCKFFGCLFLKVEEVILESYDVEFVVCLKFEDGGGVIFVLRIRLFEEFVFWLVVLVLWLKW